MKFNNKRKNWLIRGLLWGFLVFLTGEIFQILIMHKRITFKITVISLLLWLVMGLIFGVIMKEFNKENA